MAFWIQASAPQCATSFSATDRSLSDAIETVFLLETEDAFIVLKHHFIPLGYKYGFSCMIGDLIDLITAVQVDDAGKMMIEWPCNSFHARWSVSWTMEDVQIDSQWISVPGGLTELLNQAGPIALKKSAFLAEWRMPLNRILAALIASGYNQTNFKELSILERLVSALPKRGYLYRERE